MCFNLEILYHLWILLIHISSVRLEDEKLLGRFLDLNAPDHKRARSHDAITSSEETMSSREWRAGKCSCNIHGLRRKSPPALSSLPAKTRFNEIPMAGGEASFAKPRWSTKEPEQRSLKRQLKYWPYGHLSRVADSFYVRADSQRYAV